MWHLLTSWQPSHFNPHTCAQTLVIFIITWNIIYLFALKWDSFLLVLLWGSTVGQFALVWLGQVFRTTLTLCGAIMDFWWHLPWVLKWRCIASLACFIAGVQQFSDIHLFCNNCWPLDSQEAVCFSLIIVANFDWQILDTGDLKTYPELILGMFEMFEIYNSLMIPKLFYYFSEIWCSQKMKLFLMKDVSAIFVTHSQRIKTYLKHYWGIAS